MLTLTLDVLFFVMAVVQDVANEARVYAQQLNVYKV